jgi:hypothetical protein
MRLSQRWNANAHTRTHRVWDGGGEARAHVLAHSVVSSIQCVRGSCPAYMHRKEETHTHAHTSVHTYARARSHHHGVRCLGGGCDGGRCGWRSTGAGHALGPHTPCSPECVCACVCVCVCVLRPVRRERRVPPLQARALHTHTHTHSLIHTFTHASPLSLCVCFAAEPYGPLRERERMSPRATCSTAGGKLYSALLERLA